MAQEKKSSALGQYGPILAPIGGVVFAIIFIAAALGSSNVSESTADLTKQVSSARANLDNPAAIKGGTAIPLPDGVSHTYERKGTNSWKSPAGTLKLLELPIKWEVTMDPPLGDPFKQADANGDDLLDEIEFLDLPEGRTAKFDEWDRNPKDKRISRAEYKDPPIDPRTAFDNLDKDDDTFLTAEAGEILADEEYKWDWYPYDGKISFEEYTDRFKPRSERGLGPVGSVEAKLDAAKMEIVVTWQDPAIADKPEDIAFMILRLAPETVELRKADYRRRVGEYERKLRAWEDQFKKWLDDPAKDENGKTRKDKFPNRTPAEKRAAEKAFMEAVPAPLPKPVAPQQVSDWELVTEQPITGNEYRDNTFELNVTYTYAVYMATKKFPKREQNVRTDENYPDWFFHATHQVASGHPVLVRNRIEMSKGGWGEPFGSIDLTTWYKHVASDTSTWYKVRITEKVQADDPVGGQYNVGALKTKSWKLIDIAGTESDPALTLATDVSIDFSTGFRFVNRNGRGFLLTSRELGDFELPNETAGPATATASSPSTDNDLEVRCLAVKPVSGGKEAKFELTRWVKVGAEWLRVSMLATAKTGGDLGGEVSFEKLGADVTVYDATGKKLVAADIKKFEKTTVSLTAGKFEEAAGRNVKVGGTDFDLFATLYLP